MKTTIKENDRVIIPAEINGFGIDIKANVSKVETFAGKTLVQVDYVEPGADPEGGKGGCFPIEQVLKLV